MPTRIIAAWCPDWPVVAAAAAEGIPPQRPVAVLAAGRVVACSAAARSSGVRRGLRRREAQSRCAQLVVLAHDPDRDARAFEPVVSAVEALAPGVEIVQPGLVVVPARGPVAYFGSEQEVAERLVDLVAAQSEVECQIGIADGVFAATLAARRGVLVDPGATAAFLAPLAVTELLPQQPGGGAAARAREELVGLLRRLGLRTLGSFAALPVSDVASRFGPPAVLARLLASGATDRPLTRRVPPADLTVVRRFDPPVRRVDAAAFAAQEPAAQLHELLAGRGLACTRLHVHAETERGEPLARTWRCAEPLTARGTADRVRWQLDAWITAGAVGRPGPGGAITLLRLVPDTVVPAAGLQRGLWDGIGELDEGGVSGEQATRAMVRVQGMLGPDSVLTAAPGAGRDPVRQIELVPWGDAGPVPDDAPWPGRLPAPSPATVFPAGVDRPPVEVLDDRGALVTVTGRALLTARPHRVAVRGGPPQEVLGWAGPWPAEERWWEASGGRRLARLQVLLPAVALLLACENGRWQVEGIYD